MNSQQIPENSRDAREPKEKSSLSDFSDKEIKVQINDLLR